MDYNAINGILYAGVPVYAGMPLFILRRFFMKKTGEKQKRSGNGLALRLVLPILLTLAAIGGFIGTALSDADAHMTPFVMFTGYAVFAVILFVFAFLGKKYKWANIVTIVLGAIMVFFLAGIFSIVGGAKGLKSLKKKESVTESASVPEVEEAMVPKEGAFADTSAASKTLADYPVDYEHKPTVSQVLDENNTENLVLQSENDVTVEFRQLYVNVYGDKLYLVAETVDVSEEDGGGIVVFEVDYDNDKFFIEQDEQVCNDVYNQFQAASAGVNLEKKDVKRSEFVLDLYDTSVDERTWKEFKREASQEELAVIAIGAKYRIAHSRIKNIIYALGIILSIAIFWPTGGWSLIGYPIFAFLATKAIRYQDTYGQSYRKLSAEYKSFVDNCYNSSVWLTIVDGIVQFATFWLTLPYQAIMLLIGTFAPNFAISKNGILVSIPNGYDVGNLGAVGAFYKSFNFIDETLANTKSKPTAKSESSPTDDYYKRDEFTYTDSNGHTQTVYTDHDGKDAYDAGGHFVGTVSGEGSEKTFTPADSSKKTD